MMSTKKNAVESYLSSIEAKRGSATALPHEECVGNMDIAMAYDEIRQKIQHLIGIHLTMIEKQALITNKDVVNMRFNPPQIKFHAKVAEINSTNIVSTDPSLSFTFLMIRMVEGVNAKALGEYTISINGGKEKQMFKQLDVVSTFEYTKDGVPLNIVANKKQNQDVKQAFTAEVNEVRGIIKDIFVFHYEELNILKTATSRHIDGICLNNASSYSLDFFYELLLCYEIFNLMSLDIT